MAFQKIEYEFPDEEATGSELEIEGSSAVEIDISTDAKNGKAEPVSDEVADDAEYQVEVVNDTPKADRGRKASEPPADVTEEELGELCLSRLNVLPQLRLKQLNRHIERRMRQEIQTGLLRHKKV